MDKVRFNQLKSLVELDHRIRQDMPQLYFHSEDLKWLFKQAEKAQFFETSLKQISEYSFENEPQKLVEIARRALEA